MTEFTFLTYNLDGQSFDFEERLNSFISLIKSDPPDIVVVQEATRLTYEKLLREMGVLKYKRLLPESMYNRQLGEMVFCKFPMLQKKDLPFQRSENEKRITAVQIEMQDVKDSIKLWICTSQLDSNHVMKRMQIDELPLLLREIPLEESIIFGGDTKILRYQSCLENPPKGWVDVWYEAGHNDDRYTYDSETNLLVNPPYQDRPDRIWFRSGIPKLECIECKLYGKSFETAISSHYGVRAKFRLKRLTPYS